MSFFKKLLGITDMTEEEKAALQKKKEEKERKIVEKQRQANEKKTERISASGKIYWNRFW